MAGGIYKIVNLLDGKAYIGSSCNISVRFSKHRWKLNGNRHENQHLQNAWNKYGPDKFEFNIIKECPDNRLLSTEQIYLDIAKSNSSIYYNNNFVANKPPSPKGKIRSNSMRLKMSKIRKGNYLGIFPSEETKRKMSTSHSKNYEFVSPTGKIVFVQNLKKFCAQNGLNEGGMHSVNKGRKPQYKGWMLHVK